MNIFHREARIPLILGSIGILMMVTAGILGLSAFQEVPQSSVVAAPIRPAVIGTTGNQDTLLWGTVVPQPTLELTYLPSKAGEVWGKSGTPTCVDAIASVYLNGEQMVLARLKSGRKLIGNWGGGTWAYAQGLEPVWPSVWMDPATPAFNIWWNYADPCDYS